MLYYLPQILILFAVTVLAGRRWRKKVKVTPKNTNEPNGHDPQTLKGNTIQSSAGQDRVKNNGEKWSCGDLDILCRIDDRSEPVSSLAFFASGKRMATFCQGDHKVRVWSVEDDRLLEETNSSPMEHQSGVTISAMAASKDGKYIVSGDDHGNVIIWNTATHPNQKVWELAAADGRITALDVSPDSLRVASGSEDGSVVVWCINNGERHIGPLNQCSPVSSVKFSPVGCRIASAYHAVGRNACSVRIWHGCTGAQLESVPIAQSAYSLAWSADSQRLFIGGSGGSIRCFDLVTRSLLPEFRAPFRDITTTLFLTHNGQLLVAVSTGRARMIDIWDIRNFPPSEPIRFCRGIHVASILPDNARLATVGKKNDITIRTLLTIVDGNSLSYHAYPLTRELKPFTCIGNTVHEAWKSGNLAAVEEILSKEIEDPRYGVSICYERANRALVRVRQKNWAGALEDAEAAMSSNGQTSLISLVAKGLAFHGKGDVNRTMEAFQSALCICDTNVTHFVECIKSIALFDSRYLEGACCDTDTSVDLPDLNLHQLVEARKRFVLAGYYMGKNDFKKVLEQLEKIPDLHPLLYVPEVRTISLIFDWNIHSLISDVHELRCRALFESRHVPATFSYFSKGADLSEGLEMVTAHLGLLSEQFGDEAMCQHRYDEAIEWYTEALALAGYPSYAIDKGIPKPQIESNMVLDPERGKTTAQLRLISRGPRCVAHLLAKRSEGKVATKSQEGQEGALMDANQAIKIDPSYALGYRSKYMVLLGLKRHKDACVTLNELFSEIKNSNDPEIRELRKNYFNTLTEIEKIIEATFDASPFVLIHVEDGRLYNREERKRKFKDNKSFYELVSSMSTTPNTSNIKEVVESYFRYVMFSHTWEENEPSFKNVSENSVYGLDNEKLRKFCETVRNDYTSYRWSWSDTCCIDKQDSDVYQKSIRFMYKWYNNSALTLVLLADPSESTPSNSPKLEHNRWMFRAWTLQELLAPKVIRFYDRSWQLYLRDNTVNHKTSDKIRPELARATGVEEKDLIHFDPELLPVHQRLRLASTRKATVKVDVAYSLIGIFNSDIHVDYTCEAEVALGRLLQERVNRHGDITILDWVGKSSKFNSSIPADISVYSQSPYALPSITDDQLDERAKVLRRTLPETDSEITHFYRNLAALSLPRFSDRRLSLPCITFSVTSLRPDTSNSAYFQDVPRAYVGSTAVLGDFTFKTEDTSLSTADVSLSESRGPGSLVLVYPWIRDLLAKIRHRGRDELTKALTLIVYLEHGFKALLFIEQSHRQYRRVASDGEVSVPARELRSLEGLGIEVLEVGKRL